MEQAAADDGVCSIFLAYRIQRLFETGFFGSRYMRTGAASFFLNGRQVEQAELYGFLCGNKLGRADAEQPYGRTVPEFIEERAGSPVNGIAAGGRALHGGLV